MSVSALRRKSPFFNKKEMKFFPSMRTRSIQKTTTIFRNDLSKWSFETIFRNNLSKLVYEGIETFWQRRRRLSWRRRRVPSYEHWTIIWTGTRLGGCARHCQTPPLLTRLGTLPVLPSPEDNGSYSPTSVPSAKFMGHSFNSAFIQPIRH